MVPSVLAGFLCLVVAGFILRDYDRTRHKTYGFAFATQVLLATCALFVACLGVVLIVGTLLKQVVESGLLGVNPEFAVGVFLLMVCGATVGTYKGIQKRIPPYSWLCLAHNFALAFALVGALFGLLTILEVVLGK